MNIFELINKNVVTVSQDIHVMMAEMETLKREVTELKAIFNAPEEPNVHGEEGSGAVNSGH